MIILQSATVLAADAEATYRSRSFGARKRWRSLERATVKPTLATLRCG